MFCPEFTVAPNKATVSRDEVDDLSNIDSCEYIWASGVGFAHAPPNCAAYDTRRREILRFIETCFSQSMYTQPSPANGHDNSTTRSSGCSDMNRWVSHFTSCENRHALPIFTSLLNTVCSYDPTGILPYNHIIFNDSREETVEVALQVLIIALDQDPIPSVSGEDDPHEAQSADDNLFLNYLSRIHREEDFNFILKGVTRLLMNPLEHTYLPHSQRKVQFHQELLIFFWKFCEHNRKFLFFVLKSSDVLDILTPILHHLNDARSDQSRVGLMHIGVFILLLLSGERNFGVRLNKPYTATIPMDIPVFTGTHADLLIIVFHKIITTGHQRLQPLFDCLLTILCNISPYIKSMSMIASCKLMHLLEAFSTPWFLLSTPNNHHLVFFLLEMFNNIIQYQFDGNSNLVYTLIRKRQVFHALANLPTDCGSINKLMTTKKSSNGRQRTSSTKSTSSNVSSGGGSRGKSPLTSKISSNDSLFPSVASPAASPSASGHIGTPNSNASKPGVGGFEMGFKASLMEMPAIEKLTEKESAHPSQHQLDKLTKSGPSGTLFSTGSTAGSVDTDIESPSAIGSPSSVSFPKSGGGVGDSPLSQCGGGGPETTRQAAGGHGISAASMHPAGVPGTASTNLVTQKPQLPRADSSSDEQGSQFDGADDQAWIPTQEWIKSWKTKLPLQTIMRLLQVLVPQVEKICIDKGLTDESEILRFLQHGTLVGLLPVPHPILIRKYQPNPGTAMWFRTYMWGVIYLRNTDPPIWYDTDVKLFEIQRV